MFVARLCVRVARALSLPTGVDDAASLRRDVMINVEEAANGWIIRGRLNGKPVTYVASSEASLLDIIKMLDKRG